MPANETLPQPFSRLLSEHTLIHRLYQVEPGPDWPAYRYALALPNDFSDQAAVRYRAYAYLGVGHDDAQAIMSALGEAVERYGALTFPLQGQRATPSGLGPAGLSAERLRYYSDGQYASGLLGFPPPAPDRVLTWVEARELVSGRTRMLPRDLIVLHNESPEILLPGSTGLAAHTDAGRACVGALCEVVERDALMLTWLARLPGRRLLPDDWLRERLAPLQGLDRDYHLIDATRDIPLPTLICLSRQRDGLWPRWVASSACAPGAENALEAALSEHAQALAIISDQMPRDEPPADNRQHRHLWYAAARMQDADLRFLLDAGPAEQASRWRERYSVDPPTDPHGLGEMLSRLGVEAFLVDMTPTDLDRLGFHVVRVVCPELQPMSFGRRFRCLGNRRLVAGMGAGMSINPLPHPFP